MEGRAARTRPRSSSSSPTASTWTRSPPSTPAFQGRVRTSFGWGTLLTNDFRGLVDDDALAPFSLVCKAVAADGRPTVKLSDNPRKAMGPEAEIERYKRVFGVGEQVGMEVVV